MVGHKLWKITSEMVIDTCIAMCTEVTGFNNRCYQDQKLGMGTRLHEGVHHYTT